MLKINSAKAPVSCCRQRNAICSWWWNQVACCRPWLVAWGGEGPWAGSGRPLCSLACGCGACWSMLLWDLVPGWVAEVPCLYCVCNEDELLMHMPLREHHWEFWRMTALSLLYEELDENWLLLTSIDSSTSFRRPCVTNCAGVVSYPTHSTMQYECVSFYCKKLF